MNIPKILPKSNVITDFTKNKSVKTAFETAKDVAINTPNYQVPTYELRLAAKQANKNVVAKALDTVKANKKVAALTTGIVAGIALVSTFAKKVIENNNQK